MRSYIKKGLLTAGVITLVGIIATVPVVAQESVSLPQTPAAERLSELLTVFESGDETARMATAMGFAPAMLDQQPAESFARLMAQIQTRYGGFLVHRIDESNEHEIAVLLKGNTTNDWRQLRLETEAEAPYRVSSMSYGQASSPDAEEQAPSTGTGGAQASRDAEIIREWEALVQEQVEVDAFSGVVMLAKDGAPLFQKAYGLADQERSIANGLDTKFNLGSINKMFTGLAIMQLAEQGKLSVEDPIIKHLPDYANKDVAEKVTIHHMLTHTSGLGGYSWEHGALKVADILPTFVDNPLQFEPGAQMQYSNAGFAVLGRIIERVSGQDYYDYIRQHIYEPAGMADTDSYRLDEEVPNRAVTYWEEEGSDSRTPSTSLLENKGSPAGSGYSTLEGMLKFSEALKNHTLLGPEYTEIYLEGRVDMRSGIRYGYGVGEHVRNGHRNVGHNGGGPGIFADFRVYLDSGYTTVIFSNYGGREAMGIARKIEDLLTEQAWQGASHSTQGMSDSEQIEAVIEAFRISLINKDKDLFMSLFYGDQIPWYGIPNEGAKERIRQMGGNLPNGVYASSYTEFIDSIVNTSAKVEETFENVEIFEDEGIATVRFDYTYNMNDRMLNYGKESWDLIKTEEGWKIVAVLYSMTPARANEG